MQAITARWKQYFFALYFAVEVALMCALAFLLWNVPLGALGVFTVALSLLVKVGMLHQVYVLLTRKSANEHSWLNNVLNLASYQCWLFYGLRDAGVVIWLGQGSGFILSLSILTIIAKYRLRLTEFGHSFGMKCHFCTQAINKYQEENYPKRPDMGRWPMPCFSCEGRIHLVHLIEMNAPIVDAAAKTRCDTCDREREVWVSQPNPSRTITSTKFRYWTSEDGEAWREIDFDRFKELEAEIIRQRESSRTLRVYRYDGYVLSCARYEGLHLIVTTGYSGSAAKTEVLWGHCAPQWKSQVS